MIIRNMWTISWLKALVNNLNPDTKRGVNQFCPLFIQLNISWIVYSVIICLIPGCRGGLSQHSHELSTEKKDTLLAFTQSLISIPFGFEYTYDEVENFYGWQNYIYLLNTENNTIYIYDTESQSLFRKITPVAPLTQVYIYDSTHVFLLGETSLIYTDWNLRNPVTYAINPDSITDYAIGQFSYYFPMYFDQRKNDLYLQRSHWVFSYRQEESIHYSVESVLHLQTGKTDSLPVCYPHTYHRYDFGYMNNISRCAGDSLNIYSFETDPNLYIYNRYTSGLSVKGGKSAYQESPLIGYDYRDTSITEQDYLYMMVQLASYPVIQYDPYRDCYYRIYQDAQPLYNEQQKLNGTLKKKTFLQVFDSRFHLLQEFPLPSHNYHHLVVLEKGLAISRMTAKNPFYDKQNMEFDLYMPAGNSLP